ILIFQGKWMIFKKFIPTNMLLHNANSTFTNIYRKLRFITQTRLAVQLHWLVKMKATLRLLPIQRRQKNMVYEYLKVIYMTIRIIIHVLEYLQKTKKK